MACLLFPLVLHVTSDLPEFELLNVQMYEKLVSNIKKAKSCYGPRQTDF